MCVPRNFLPRTAGHVTGSGEMFLSICPKIHFAEAHGGLCNLSLQWRHNGRNGVSNHQPHECLLGRLFNAQIKENIKARVTGLCVVNSPVTGEFPAQRASNAENVSIWWRNRVYHWDRDELTAILQTIFSNWYSCTKIDTFLSKFHCTCSQGSNQQ